MRPFVERSVLVSDEAIRSAQRALWEVLRVAAEPGGVAALAALLSGADRPARDERVTVLLCGANTTAVDFDRRGWLTLRNDTAAARHQRPGVTSYSSYRGNDTPPIQRDLIGEILTKSRLAAGRLVRLKQRGSLSARRFVIPAEGRYPGQSWPPACPTELCPWADGPWDDKVGPRR